MKKASSVVSSLITTLMLAAVVCIQAEPVKDTDGNEVIHGEQYFIQVKTQENNGSGLAPAPPKLFPLCPLGIVKTIIPTDIQIDDTALSQLLGLPVSFKVVGVPEKTTEKTTVETSSAVNIKFESDIWACTENDKFWRVDDSSTAAEEPFILTGDKPEEEKSQFKIEKTEDANTYKFTTSDGSSPIGTIPGPSFLSGAPQLVLTKQDDTKTKSLIVTFKKVKVDATTITSRFEKLGLRFFPLIY